MIAPFRHALLLAFGTSAVACSASRAPEASSAPAPAATSTASAAPPASAPEVPVASSERDANEPQLCGCSLCEPVVSEDACTRDDECAPATPCHADRCIAKAKASPRPAGQMCTMMMACHSVDANECGCFRGRCALTPRKRS